MTYFGSKIEHPFFFEALQKFRFFFYSSKYFLFNVYVLEVLSKNEQNPRKTYQNNEKPNKSIRLGSQNSNKIKTNAVKIYYRRLQINKIQIKTSRMKCIIQYRIIYIHNERKSKEQRTAWQEKQRKRKLKKKRAFQHSHTETHTQTHTGIHTCMDMITYDT